MLKMCVAITPLLPHNNILEPLILSENEFLNDLINMQPQKNYRLISGR